jgi:hypothetical protein
VSGSVFGSLALVVLFLGGVSGMLFLLAWLEQPQPKLARWCRGNLARLPRPGSVVTPGRSVRVGATDTAQEPVAGRGRVRR